MSAAAPLVSIVIPCFNHGHYLDDALASVRAQTWTDWEVVIVDDGSTDATPATIERLLATIGDPRIRALRQTNQGLSAARNAGIAQARGEFFVPLDADDRLRPSMLAACLTPLRTDASLGFAYGHMQTFGVESREVRYPPYNLWRLLDENQVTVCALVRTRAWREVGGYKPAMCHGAEDWEFWLSCAELGWHGQRVDEVLFEYRRHHVSMWTETEKKLPQIREQLAAMHPRLYSSAGRNAVRRAWRSSFDPHAKDSVFVRVAELLPAPLRHAAERLYRRVWL